MKLKTTLILALTLTTSGFVNAQKVKVQKDKEADFSKYKTLTFIGWQEDSDQLMDDKNRELMLNTFVSELKSRGLEEGTKDADLAVSLYLVLEEKSNTESYTNFYGESYAKGRGSQSGWGWKNGYSTSPYSKNFYIKGTLVMDVYDNKSNLLIWQSVASDVIKEDPEKRKKAIPKAVKKMMLKYPVKPAK